MYCKNLHYEIGLKGLCLTEYDTTNILIPLPPLLRGLKSAGRWSEIDLREASLFMAQGGRHPAEWAKFFGRAIRSGRIFLEVCLVVGEKF